MPEQPRPLSPAEYEARLAQARQRQNQQTHSAQPYVLPPISPRPVFETPSTYPSQEPVRDATPEQSKPTSQETPRVPRQHTSAPHSGEIPLENTAPGTTQQTGKPKNSKEHSRHKGIKVCAVGTLVLAGIGLVGYKFILPHEEEGTQVVAADNGVESVVSSIQAVGAEGLNPQNCDTPGSAVVTALVNAREPLIYMLTPPGDGAKPTKVDKYITKSIAAKDPKLEPFGTESGYTELTAVNQPIEFHVCEDPEATSPAVTTSDGKTKINLSSLIVKAEAPTEYTIVPQKDSAHITASDLSPTAYYTYPIASYLPNDTKAYTADSLAAVNGTFSKDAWLGQAKGAINLEVSSVVAALQNADPKNEFNQHITFDANDMHTLYDALYKGLKQRVGGDTSIEGTLSNFKVVAGAEQPKQIMDVSKDQPTQQVLVDSLSIKLGDYTVKRAVQPSTTPSQEATNE